VCAYVNTSCVYTRVYTRFHGLRIYARMRMRLHSEKVVNSIYGSAERTYDFRVRT
jgi:hypothetical protein